MHPPVKMMAAAASVAWPQSGTSTLGVNQRSRKMLAILKWSAPDVAATAVGSICAAGTRSEGRATGTVWACFERGAGLLAAESL